tara:strand:+ start:5640 stop:5795 length:156 start_codon:yes stop_codon:yes gene_type:complete
MTKYTFQKVRFNGVNGWIVTRWVNGVHAGKAFGKTKKAAIEQFDEELWENS